MTEEKQEEIEAIDEANGVEIQPMEKIVEDPLAKFLKRHQNAILNILLVVSVCYVGFQFYTKSVKEAQERAADAFNGLRQQVVELIDKDGKLKEIAPKLKSSIEENFNAMLHERKPYDALALAYKNLYQLKAGELKDYDGALAALNAIPKTKKPYSNGKLFAEMAGLLILRSELDDEALRSKAYSGLIDMAKNSQYLKLPAALAAAHTAESDEEREEVRVILENIKDSAPTHASLIDAELDQL